MQILIKIILHNPLIKINNQSQSVYLTFYLISNIHNATVIWWTIHIYIYIYAIYISYSCIIYRIYSYPIFSIYNIYLQHIHYESAYMYTVGWDAGRISIYVILKNKRSVLLHPRAGSRPKIWPMHYRLQDYKSERRAPYARSLARGSGGMHPRKILFWQIPGAAFFCILTCIFQDR